MKLIRIKGRGNEQLYKHPTTGIIYYCQSKKDRGRIERSTRTTNLVEARTIADQFRFEFLGIAKIKRGRDLIKDLFPKWIEQKSATKRPNTISSIKNTWKHLEPYIGSMLPEQITPAWWESVYVPGKRTETNNPKRKFANDRKWLSSFLIHLQREGQLARVPKLILPDPPPDPGEVYTDEEIRSLLADATDHFRLQVLMAVTMGMRIGEIMNLAWDRVDFKHRTINLRADDTKIKKARSFGISDDVWPLLSARRKNGSPYVFPSTKDPNKPMGRQGNKTAWANKRAKLSIDKTFHELRHTFLTRAFKESINPALICKYAGLTMEEAMRTYLHFDVDDTRPVAGLVSITGKLRETEK